MKGSFVIGWVEIRSDTGSVDAGNALELQHSFSGNTVNRPFTNCLWRKHFTALGVGRKLRRQRRITKPLNSFINRALRLHNSYFNR